MGRIRQWLKNLAEPDYIKDDQTTELAMAIKALCEFYQIKSKNLCKFTHMSLLWNQSEKIVRHVRQISIGIPIPERMSPTTDSLILDLTLTPNPNIGTCGITRGRMEARPFGLNELVLKTDCGNLRLWRLQTYNTEGPLGPNVIFVERKNLKKLYRHLLLLQRQLPKVYIPILSSRQLQDIYDNSIGFLEKGQVNIEKYKEHNIPCKRGILLSGPPG
ncbi:MAG TPA: hypothetical protein ENH60_02470, partial [Pricia sp.]|nr:hypothetical protein [Pricia sp.]